MSVSCLMIRTIGRTLVLSSSKTQIVERFHNETLIKPFFDSKHHQSSKLSSLSNRMITSSSSSSSSSSSNDSILAWDSNQDIDYEELKPITQTPNDEVLLIDVREQDEVIQGNIPSSVNLPLSNYEKSLDLHDDDFKSLNSFKKPVKDQKIVVYCRSGKRSQTAVEIGRLKGFKRHSLLAILSITLCS